MPVSDEHALRQFEIEALQRINDNLRLLSQQQQKLVDSLHSIDIRLVKIEANNISSEVEELKKEVEELKTEKNKRDGAVNLATWIFRNWPGVVAFLAAVFGFLKLTGKI